MNPTNYYNNKRLSFIAALLLGAMALLGLQACGGSGGSGGGSDPDPVPDVDVSGIYDGTFTESGGGVHILQGVIHENRAMFILEDGIDIGNALIYDGTLTIDGNTFSSSFKEYNQSETTLTGSAFDITGSVDENAVVTITATSPTLGQGTIRLTLNTARLAIGADLSNIIFSWTSSPVQNFIDGDLNLFFNAPTFVSNTPDGVYVAGIGSCNINLGLLDSTIRVTIPDSSKNTYLVTSVIDCSASTVAIDGTYTGLIYSTGTTISDSLIYIVAKDDRAIAAVMLD